MLLLPIVLLWWARAPLAFSPAARWILLGLLAFGLQQGNLPPVSAADDAASVVRPAAAPQPRQREGTPLRAAAGRFMQQGSRWAFVTDAGGSTYRVLENLALDRVVTAIRQDASDDRWTVEAVITEFSGENFLLLRTVVRAASTAKSADPAASSSSGQPDGNSAPSPLR